MKRCGCLNIPVATWEEVARPRSVAIDLMVALAVQGLSFAVSAVSAFITPRVMPVDAFGYWQLFLFYVGYLGYLQGGLSDGVYLRFGGIARGDVDASRTSAHFWVLFISQVVVGGGLIALGISSLPVGRGEVIVALGVLLPIFSAKRLLGYLFQAMGETRRFSFSLLVSAVTLIVPLGVLVVSGVRSTAPYLTSYIAAETAGLVYCLLFARGLVVRPRFCEARELMRDVWASVTAGFRLLVATSAGALIVGVSRIVIDERWDIGVFAQISLAVTMVSFILALMAQVSLVLYPALKQASEVERRSVLLHLRVIAAVLLPVGYLVYFPFSWALTIWLPNYAFGVAIAAWLMPMCVFDGLMQVLYSTYFKVYRAERALMYLNLGSVTVAAIGAVLGAYVLNSVEAVLVASVVAGAIRVIAADAFFRKGMATDWSGVVESGAVVGALFVASVQFLPLGVAALAATGSLCVFVALWWPQLSRSLGAMRLALREPS